MAQYHTKRSVPAAHMSDQPLKRPSDRSVTRADVYFAAFFFVAAVLLLAQISEQTKWIDGTKLFTQPRFWPAVSLIGMTVFSLIYLISSFYKGREKKNTNEVVLWGKSLEYAVWFMGYVVVVPIIGYFLSTLVFMYALSLRTGYRERTILMMAGAVGIVIVVVFKGFLSVKIPGGQLYEFFPGTLRNFMILYM